MMLSPRAGRANGPFVPIEQMLDGRPHLFADVESVLRQRLFAQRAARRSEVGHQAFKVAVNRREARRHQSATVARRHMEPKRMLTRRFPSSAPHVGHGSPRARSARASASGGNVAPSRSVCPVPQVSQMDCRMIPDSGPTLFPLYQSSRDEPRRLAPPPPFCYGNGTNVPLRAGMRSAMDGTEAKGADRATGRSARHRAACRTRREDDDMGATPGGAARLFQRVGAARK